MCRIPTNFTDERASTAATASGPAFTCERLNGSTFVLEEHDKWSENPLIYVKVLPETIVLIDTGCGGANQTPGVEGTLKSFLENTPVEANENRPLNQDAKPYTVICTHFHYDHIGGISELGGDARTAIWASALGRSIITDPERLSSASLCRFVGMETPRYTVTNWAEDQDQVTDKTSRDLGLVIYQTPGHTPDQVAIWDATERHLFVGDTLYEDAPILFPNGGDINHYRQSIQKLQSLVRDWNSSAGDFPRRVQMASGHITRTADADELLGKVDASFAKVCSGLVEADDITSQNPGWAGGEPAVEFSEGTGGVYFHGLRSVFSGLPGCL